MTNPLNDFLSSWGNPQLRHALMVHWPIVLSVLSLLFVVGLAINKGKSALLRMICLLVCLGFMVLGYITMQSGGNAENAAGLGSADADKVLDEHEEFGEKVPVFGAGCVGLVALTFIPQRTVRIIASWRAAVGCGGSAPWLGSTGHRGGLWGSWGFFLVYGYGVGAPQVGLMGSSAQSAESSVNEQWAASFRTEAWPIIEAQCIKCHNPDRGARGKSGKFDQTTLAAFLKGGRSGPATIPGKPEE